MKKTVALLLSLLLIFALVACGGSNKASTEDTMMNYSASAPAEKAESFSGGGIMEPGAADIFTTADSSIYNDPNAKVIRTARMTLQTLDFDRSVSDLAALTEQYGGYYETANVDSGGYYNQHARRSAYYVVRIPKEHFVSFRDAIGSVGHIYSFSEDAQNVGEEYYDTEARLETLETKRERLLALLDKAELMEDIISLESALADVQYEIDRHATTLRKYDSLIDYSTFTIDLDEVIKIEDDPGPQESFGTRLVASLKAGLEDFADGVQNFAFWAARNLITLVILAVVLVVIIRIVIVIRRKRRNYPED